MATGAAVATMALVLDGVLVPTVLPALQGLVQAPDRPLDLVQGHIKAAKPLTFLMKKT